MEFASSAIKYLKTNRIIFSESFIKTRILSHPDYPALTSLTDTLDEIGLPYSAIIVDKERYSELKYPLLAHFNNNGKEGFINVKSKEQFEQQDDNLIQIWDGVAIMVEVGALIKHEAHNTKLKNENKENRIYHITLLTFLGLILIINFFSFNILTFILTILSIGGVLISGLIMLHSMGKSNALTEQLCSADGTSGCEKIIKSKSGKISKNIGWDDIGVSYFVGLTAFLTFSSFLKAPTNEIISILIIPYSIASILVFVSIYYQWKIAKSWCKMCLITASVVTLETIFLFFIISSNDFYITSSLKLVLLFFLTFIAPILLILSIKPLFLKDREIFNSDLSLLKWKRNHSTLSSLFKIQRKIDIEVWEDDLVIGNLNAPVQVMVACNPFCGPCAAAHKLLHNILETHTTNIALTIRFAIKYNEKSNKRNIAVEKILKAAKAYYITDMHNNPVDVWFNLMNLDEFDNIYKTSNIDNVDKILEKHSIWSEESRIDFTPTIFINGYQLPSQYNFNDLPIIMPQIIEIFTQNSLVYNSEF
ncbi:MAG: hypothetical protein RJA25_2463 [Bacteroidota bacterium]|jgi:hypothetical protein